MGAAPEPEPAADSEIVKAMMTEWEGLEEEECAQAASAAAAAGQGGVEAAIDHHFQKSMAGLDWFARKAGADKKDFKTFVTGEWGGGWNKDNLNDFNDAVTRFALDYHQRDKENVELQRNLEEVHSDLKRRFDTRFEEERRKIDSEYRTRLDEAAQMVEQARLLPSPRQKEQLRVLQDEKDECERARLSQEKSPAEPQADAARAAAGSITGTFTEKSVDSFWEEKGVDVTAHYKFTPNEIFPNSDIRVQIVGDAQFPMVIITRKLSREADFADTKRQKAKALLIPFSGFKKIHFERSSGEGKGNLELKWAPKVSGYEHLTIEFKSRGESTSATSMAPLDASRVTVGGTVHTGFPFDNARKIFAEALKKIDPARAADIDTKGIVEP